MLSMGLLGNKQIHRAEWRAKATQRNTQEAAKAGPRGKLMTSISYVRQGLWISRRRSQPKNLDNSDDKEKKNQLGQKQKWERYFKGTTTTKITGKQSRQRKMTSLINLWLD